MTAKVVVEQPERREPGLTVTNHQSSEPLRECVRKALNLYFQHIGEHDTNGLYQMVISEVEEPLLQAVMQHTGGNQTRAAAVLGISRSTLRKKLTQYHLD